MICRNDFERKANAVESECFGKKIKRNHIVEKDFIRFEKRRGKYVVFTCQ